MKMQNAEMEFVAFDAQDVITTSGPVPGPATAKFTVGVSLFDYPSGASKESYSDGEWGWKSGRKGYTQQMQINGDSAGDGVTWVLTQGVSSYSGNVTTAVNSDGVLYINGATSGNEADEELTSLDKIIEWLGVNKQ